MSLCLAPGRQGKGRKGRGARGPPPLTAGAGDPRLRPKAGSSRAQSPGPKLGCRGPASALSHSEGTLVGSPDPPPAAASWTGSCQSVLAIFHVSCFLALPLPLWVSASVSDAGVSAVMPLFPSLWVPHARGPDSLPDRLSAGLCMQGRGQVSPWELGLQVGPAGAVPGQAGAVSRHDPGHLARPGRARAEGMNSGGKVARFSK